MPKRQNPKFGERNSPHSKKGKLLNEGNFRYRDQLYLRQGDPVVQRRPIGYRSPPDSKSPTDLHTPEPSTSEGYSHRPGSGPDLAARQLFQEIEDMNDIDMDDIDAPREKRDIGGPNGGGGAAPSDNMSKQLILSKSIKAKPQRVTFHRSGIYTSWAYAHSFHALEVTPGNEGYSRAYFTTPLAYVPVDWIPFYMSEIEFQNLPPQSRITEVRCNVVLMGTRTSFDTATTLTGAANNSHVIFGQHAVGLNHKILMKNRKYTSDATKPMIPTSCTILSTQDTIKRLYGEKVINSNTATNHVYPTIFNTIRTLPGYACLYDNMASSTAGYTGHGFPRLDKHVAMYNQQGQIDQTIIQYKYRPHVGAIKQAVHHYPGYPGDSYFSGSNISTLTRLKTSAQTAGYSVTLSASKDNGMFPAGQGNQVLTWDSPVEKQFMLSRMGTQNGMVTQPQVHVGIQAVQSNTPTDADPQFVNASAYYKIETEVDIEYTFDEPYVSEDSMYYNGNAEFLHGIDMAKLPPAMYSGYNPMMMTPLSESDQTSPPTPKKKGVK